jgi:hypothetical protein
MLDAPPKCQRLINIWETAARGEIPNDIIWHPGRSGGRSYLRHRNQSTVIPGR